MKASAMRLILNLYPPFAGAGVRVKRITADYREIDVEMKLRFWNHNIFGTHFGGSLYAMTDPFYVLMIMKNLGKNYIVWDKSAAIRFKAPGRGTVWARFRLTEEELAAIRAETDAVGKSEPRYTVDVVDGSENLIARVEKHLHITRKSL